MQPDPNLPESLLGPHDDASHRRNRAAAPMRPAGVRRAGTGDAPLPYVLDSSESSCKVTVEQMADARRSGASTQLWGML